MGCEWKSGPVSVCTRGGLIGISRRCVRVSVRGGMRSQCDSHSNHIVISMRSQIMFVANYNAFRAGWGGSDGMGRADLRGEPLHEGRDELGKERGGVGLHFALFLQAGQQERGMRLLLREEGVHS